MSDTFKQDVDKIKQDLTLIKHALLGNDFNKVGLIKRVDYLEKDVTEMKNENLETRLVKLESFKKDITKLKYKIIGGSIAISALIAFLINIIAVVFKIKDT